MGVYLQTATRFWRITRISKSTSVNTICGRIGFAGRTVHNDFADVAKASSFIAKQVAEEKKKGCAAAVDPAPPSIAAAAVAAAVCGGAKLKRKKTASGAAKKAAGAGTKLKAAPAA